MMSFVAEETCAANRESNSAAHLRYDKAIEGLWSAVTDIRDRLANRLPTWATVLIGVLCALLGALATLVYND